MHLGLVVEEEGRVPGTCVVEFSLRLRIPNSTGSFKLDRQLKQALLECTCPHYDYLLLKKLLFAHMENTLNGKKKKKNCARLS
jgi:hypothetical protein